jgi:hypothetical protein
MKDKRYELDIPKQLSSSDERSTLEKQTGFSFLVREHKKENESKKVYTSNIME